MDVFLLLLDCHDVSSFHSMSMGTVLFGKKAFDETTVIISGKRKKIWISHFRANCH